MQIIIERIARWDKINVVKALIYSHNNVGTPVGYTCFRVSQFSSVAQSCPILCDPIDCSTPGPPVHHQLLEFTQTHVHWVVDAIQPIILCHPLLLLPSIFPSIRVFSNESALRMRWQNYWSYSFNISLSNEYPGLISFRMDRLWILMHLRKYLNAFKWHYYLFLRGFVFCN